MAKRHLKIGIRKDCWFFISSEMRLLDGPQPPLEERFEEYDLHSAPNPYYFAYYKELPDGKVGYIFNGGLGREEVIELKSKFTEICDFDVHALDTAGDEYSLEVQDMSIGEAFEHIWQTMCFFQKGDEFKEGLENIWVKRIWPPIEDEQWSF